MKREDRIKHFNNLIKEAGEHIDAKELSAKEIVEKLKNKDINKNILDVLDDAGINAIKALYRALAKVIDPENN